MTRIPWEGVAWPRLAVAALLCSVVLAPGHLATPDAHLRLAQARNLVNQGSLAVPEGVGDPTHGNLAQGREGRIHSVYNPGHVLLLAAVYGIASVLPTPFHLHPHYAAAFGASFLGILAHLLTSLLLFALLLRLGREPRMGLIIAALFAFGTVSLPSAADGYDHVFEALTLVLSLHFLVEDEDDERKIQPALAGLALGAGVLFRYTVLLALPGLLWVARDRQSRFQVLLGVAPAIFLALSYNFHRFGSFFETGYPAAWQFAHGNEISQTGFRLTEIPGNVVGLLASPGKGLLWFCPLIALAIPAWVSFRRVRPRVADGVTAIAALYLLFYGANFAWHGSVWSWGPRYIEPIVPLIVVSMSFLPKRQIWRSLLIVVGVVSVSIQASAMTADHRRHLLMEYTEDSSGFEQRLLYDPSSSPVIGQFESARHVLRASVKGGDYRPFIAPGPWRSVARPASNELMLERSIDLNSIDLWWIRLVFFSPGSSATLTAILVGGLGSVATVWLMESVWRTAPEA